MKKKLLIAIICSALCLGVTGCSKGDIEPEAYFYGNKYIDLVTVYKREDLVGRSQVSYDRNTKVMYYIVKSGYGMAMTPIYNADGTLKLYEE